MSRNIELIHGDCFSVLPKLIERKEKVDMVLVDLPYGLTRCAWDTRIDLVKMWTLLSGIVKANGAMVFTASQPFTTTLICSNKKQFRYCWVWEKPHAKGHFNAKKRPMVAHEDVVIFYEQQPTYNPQITFGHPRKTAKKRKELNSEVYNKNTKTTYYDSATRYPRTVQLFPQDTQKSKLHPTQKPLEMMRYFIRTYSNPGDIVLDFCMGSGTTGVAAIQEKRRFIGVEKNTEYFKTANNRIYENNN